MVEVSGLIVVETRLVGWLCLAHGIGKLTIHLLDITDICFELFDLLTLLTEQFEGRLMTLSQLFMLDLQSLEPVIDLALGLDFTHQIDDFLSSSVSLTCKPAEFVFGGCFFAFQATDIGRKPFNELN
jgi:hypothetical protein